MIGHAIIQERCADSVNNDFTDLLYIDQPLCKMHIYVINVIWLGADQFKHHWGNTTSDLDQSTNVWFHQHFISLPAVSSTLLLGLKSEVLGQCMPFQKPWHHAFIAQIYTFKCECKDQLYFYVMLNVKSKLIFCCEIFSAFLNGNV